MSLLQAAKAARHDVGKYIAFQLRWLPDDAPADELLEALRSDVLRTRRGPSGVESAPQVWARVREPLSSLDLHGIDTPMAELEAALGGLEDGTLQLSELRVLRARAIEVSDALGVLFRAVREKEND
ncbi:MAG: hypothetical protein GY913_20725 [Proteobacteria bacterium]|nr:hypothetical protein [Pseudomonadota bacterium]MCP4919333.1 hypothetical protein [Pseudomonadota bacterium]